MTGDSTESAAMGRVRRGWRGVRRMGRKVLRGIKDMQSVRRVIKSIRVHDENPNCMRRKVVQCQRSIESAMQAHQICMWSLGPSPRDQLDESSHRPNIASPAPAKITAPYIAPMLPILTPSTDLAPLD